MDTHRVQDPGRFDDRRGFVLRSSSPRRGATTPLPGLFSSKLGRLQGGRLVTSQVLVGHTSTSGKVAQKRFTSLAGRKCRPLGRAIVPPTNGSFRAGRVAASERTKVPGMRACLASRRDRDRELNPDTAGPNYNSARPVRVFQGRLTWLEIERGGSSAGSRPGFYCPPAGRSRPGP